MRAVNTGDVVSDFCCKDCVFCDKYVAPGRGVVFICSQGFGNEVEENHFCSHGKQRLSSLYGEIAGDPDA